MHEFLVTNGLISLVPVLEAILIFIIGLLVRKVAKKWLNTVLKKTSIDPMIYTFIAHVFEIVIWVVVLIAILGKFGIDSSSIVTIIAACGAAIALALQNSLSNLASGILIMTTQPFHKGDYIVSSNVEGTVDSIDLLYTIIIADDMKRITVPNSLLTTNTIVNYTRKGARRYEQLIGVSYNTDVAYARKVLIEMLANDPRTLKDPAPSADVVSYDDSAITIKIKGWAKSDDYLSYLCEMTNSIKGTLDKAGISIPFPQVDVHMDK